MAVFLGGRKGLALEMEMETEMEMMETEVEIEQAAVTIINGNASDL